MTDRRENDGHGPVDRPVAGTREAGPGTTPFAMGPARDGATPSEDEPAEGTITRSPGRSAGPEPDPARPGHVHEDRVVEEVAPSADGPWDEDEITIDALMDATDGERFQARWRDVKTTFVDDPRAAIHQASALSAEVVDELAAALQRRRQAIKAHLDADGDTGTGDTERMRVVLRGYGSLIERLLA
jgi:hypothetical protein